MEPTKEFIDELYAEEVVSARSLPIEQKIFYGIELFDFACEFTKAGIRSQHPDANPDEVLSLLCERLDLGKQLEEWL